MQPETKKRCDWVDLDKPDYVRYHDTEWGRPVHDDGKLFEFLVLEGAQAGLSWYTILKRREEYRKVFKNFKPEKVAAMSDQELEVLVESSTIIRHRLKIFSVRNNARVFLDIQKEFGSFDRYLWNFVDNKPIINRYIKQEEVPSYSPLSIALSNDLKKRGMSFVGKTIMYAYMQAMGLIDGHMKYCYLCH